MLMDRFRLAAASASVLALSACAAGTSVGADYPLHTADAKVFAGAREYAIWFHATRPTIFVQRNAGAMFGDAIAETLTLGVARRGDPLPFPRAAAQALIEDAGCSLVEIYEVGAPLNWEAQYTCEGGGIVTQEAVNANRARWRAGLRTADPLAPTPATTDGAPAQPATAVVEARG